MPKPEDKWILNFTINNEKHFISYENKFYSQEVKKGDILIMEKPDKDFYSYIKTTKTYDIKEFKPLVFYNSGIYIFNKTITEEFTSLIIADENCDEYYSSSAYTLCYGKVNEIEYNELITHPLEITNNPYKYLKKDENDKYFFLFLKSNSYNAKKILKINGEQAIYENKLNLVKKNNYEAKKMKFPKNDEKAYVFIQYFNDNLKVLYKNKEITPLFSGNDYMFLLFEKDSEPFGYIQSYLASESIIYFYYNDSYDEDFEKIKEEELYLSYIKSKKNKIEIFLENYGNPKMYYNLTFFIASDINQKYFPMKLLYEGRNDTEIKSYTFQRYIQGYESIEIPEIFPNDKMVKIILIAQELEGLRKYTCYNLTYNHIADKKSESHALIIVITIVIILLVILGVIFFYFYRKKKNSSNIIENNTKIGELLDVN